MIMDDITRALDTMGVAYTLHAHEGTPGVTVRDAVENLPFPPEQMLKTVVFRIKGGDWVLAGVRGVDKVDYRKLGDALGVRRQDLVRPSAPEVEAGLGFQIGGICPIALRDGVRVIFDSRTQVLGTVYCGAGRNDHTLELHLPDLVRATAAPVAPIVQENEGQE